jgi:5-methylcytosine-specific restriction endonuclease McrA
MWSMARADKNQVMARLDIIAEAFIVLMTEDQDFISSIELSTSSSRAITTRFDKWRTTLDAIQSSDSKQPRCFSRELKERLYKADPTCKLCGQHIADLDDAAVDHIQMYWLGGATIPENARLTHRYCNWARPKSAPVQ